MLRRDQQLGRSRFLLLASLLAAATMLSGCESQARQDPIYVRNSTDTLVFTDTAFFRDRPLDDSLRSSLQLADYARSLELTGLIAELQRPGPYTVFAIPNAPLETLRGRYPQLLNQPYLPNLKRTLSYTIVRGNYPDTVLRGMINKAHGPIGLHTLYGDVIAVQIDPATNQLILSDPTGQQSRIWLSSMPQSNGTLYVTQSMLNPGPAQTQSGRASIASR